MLDHTDSLWEISSPKDYPSFLRSLNILIPSNATLYIEDGSDPPDELKSYIEAKCLHDKPIIPMGTIWPKPTYYHIPATENTLNELANIAEHCAEPQVATHFHVYSENRMIIQWYDAFFDPMFVANIIHEDKVREFCNQLGIKYKRTKSNKILQQTATNE